MIFNVAYRNDTIYLSWSSKSPKTERDLNILGGRWEDFNTYRFGFDEVTAKKVLTYAKRNGTLEFATGAKETLAEMVRRSRAAEALTSAAADAEIDPRLAEYPSPAAESLRPYQRAGVKFLAQNTGSLLADQPGLGKTLSTVASIISAGVTGDILVLAPSVAASISWPAELAYWAPKDEVVVLTGTRKQREKKLEALRVEPSADRRWFLCNTEMVRTEYVEKHIDDDGKAHPADYVNSYPELFWMSKNRKKEREWAAIIVDEAHNSLITKQSQPYKQTLARRGFSKLQTKEDGKRIALSGTPFRGRPENLWGILNWLYPKQYTSYWKWAERWFEIEKGYFGGVEDMRLRETEKMAFYKSIQPIMLRRTKAEVAPDLPPKMYAGTVPAGVDYDDPLQRSGLVGHWLEMSKKQAVAYEEMEEFATAALDNGTLVANGVLSELTRLKQFATCYGKLDTKIDAEGFEVPIFVPTLPSNKLDWLMEFLDELGIDGKPHEDQRKLVVASQFTSIIDVFAAEIERKKKLPVLKITGKVKQSKREEAVEKFQTDDQYQLLMLNTKAGGVALTLDRADDIVILDETFIPDDQEQVEDRIHRVSRMHNVTVHYVRSLGTVEEKIARKTIDRENLQKQLIDGTRGVEYARHLLED